MLAAALAAAGTTTGTGAGADAPLPFPVTIEARFDLVDQTGTPRSAEDFHGDWALVFFGFLRCDAICDVALARMAETLDALGTEGARLAPILITIDPADTPAALAAGLPAIHPRLIGLTGDAAALAAARAAFQVEATKLFEAPDGTPVYAHGGFLYLVDPDGRVQSVLPPVMSPARMADIIRSRVAGG